MLKKSRGFLMLESLVSFTLGLLLLFGALQLYQASMSIMQRKLHLEEALQLAEAVLADSSYASSLLHEERETFIPAANLSIKEVDIIYEDKIIFSLAAVKRQ